jgi:hypothetical protein
MPQEKKTQWKQPSTHSPTHQALLTGQ